MNKETKEKILGAAIMGITGMAFITVFWVAAGFMIDFLHLGAA